MLYWLMVCGITLCMAIGRRVGSVGAALLAASLTMGQSAPRAWGPNGNGTLDHADDRRWLPLAQASITADDARGVYIASFSPAAQRLGGTRLTISGYMLPIEASTLAAHFVLTRRSTGCPFCPPNEPSEAIEIAAARPMAYTQQPVTLSGTLRLVRQSATGLFYRLDGAVSQ